MPTVMELLQKYYDEAHGGLNNDTSPSQLRCGEGTQADYFILKIDLCKSTAFIQGKRAQTYLKMAHVFLSTVDRGIHLTQPATIYCGFTIES